MECGEAAKAPSFCYAIKEVEKQQRQNKNAQLVERLLIGEDGVRFQIFFPP